MNRRVFQFLEDLYREKDTRACPPSAMGAQLERARDGTQEIDFRNPFAFEERNHRHVVRLLIWRSLSRTARVALAMKSDPVSWEYRYRVVHESELVPDTRFVPPVMTTKSGEELALEYETKNPPPQNHRIVCSPRPIFLTNREVAERLEVSQRHLRTILSKAYAAIEEHPLFEQVMRN